MVATAVTIMMRIIFYICLFGDTNTPKSGLTGQERRKRWKISPTILENVYLTTVNQTKVLKYKTLSINTLYNVCGVPWGYHDKCGGYLEYHRGCSVPWGIPSFVIWVPWGISWCMWGISWVPWGVQYVGGTQITKDFFPYGTHDIPHVYHDIPHSTEYPLTVLKITPSVLMISPTVLNTPTVLKISPTFIMISPTFIMISPTVPSRYCTSPHGTAHTLYRVINDKIFGPTKVRMVGPAPLTLLGSSCFL